MLDLWVCWFVYFNVTEYVLYIIEERHFHTVLPRESNQSKLNSFEEIRLRLQTTIQNQILALRYPRFSNLYNTFACKQLVKQSTLIVIVVMAAAAGTLWLQSIEYAQSTGKLIDTSTGESTERVARSGTVGETAPAGTLAGVTLSDRKAPPAITGDNVYLAWWTNDTANSNEEVMFRASTDGGQSFGDRINLSNTTDADSTRVEIDSDADSVVVTWWETNQTDDTPVIRVSNDNGATFGPQLQLATNGTIGQAAEEEQG